MNKTVKTLLASICLFSFVACSSNTQEVPELLEPVGAEIDTAVVTTGQLTSMTSYSAVVVPYVEELYFESGGVISECNIVLGDEVEEGDVLIELDISNIEAQIEATEESIAYNEMLYSYTNSQLEIEIEMAELTYDYLLSQAENYEDYYELLAIAEQEALEKAEAEELAKLEAEANGEEYIPDEETETAEIEKPDGDDVNESELVIAAADVEEAKLNLSQEKATQEFNLEQLNDTLDGLKESMVDNQIVAPFSGTIVYFENLIAGDSVSAEEIIIYIADSSNLSVSTDYLNSTSITNALKVVALINGNEYEIEYVPMSTTEYFSLYLVGDTVMSSFEFTSDYSSVSAGEFVNLEIYTKIIDDALLIPINTVLESNDGQYYVYVVEDGTLIKTAVTKGDSNEVYIEIIEGLEEGDVVYVGD